MTGSPFSWENRESLSRLTVPTTPTKSNDYIDYSYAKYLGGHPLYLAQTSTSVYVYNNRIEVVDPELAIPYFAISRIENMDEKKISALRVVGLGLIALPLAIVGALWKKKHTYTVIQYKDEFDEKTLIIDFDADVYRIQPLIYNKMIESRRTMF